MELNRNVALEFAQNMCLNFELQKFPINKEIAISFLLNELSNEYNQLNQIKVQQERFQLFQMAEPRAYQEYLVDTSFGKVIMGIRHKGLEKTLPFINIKTSFPLKTKEQVLEIYEPFKKYFDAFKPRWLRIDSKTESLGDITGQIDMVGKISDYLKTKHNENEIDLEMVKDESYYSWYKNEYVAFHQLRSEIAQDVTLNSLEIMNESMREGLLFWILKNDERIGLIAGVSGPYLGHEGLYFNEILIANKHWRKGYAKAAQKKFVLENANNKTLIWGTIDKSNPASLRTALANGRSATKYELFICL